ncbi:PhoH family protein [bacterium]|nr:PhoH family protein [bacterium]
MNEQASRRIELGDLPPVSVFGQNDANLRIIRDLYGARIVARGTEILLDGPPGEIEALDEIFRYLMSVASQGRWVSPSDVRYAIRMVRNRNGEALNSLNGDAATLRPMHGLRKEIAPKTVNQAEYLSAIQEADVVFAIGPAGTGKTYLAMAAALSALNRREIERIHLVRPAVDAGESLGFLPGDFTEKVAPYLRPLYDALNDMMPIDRVQKLLDTETVEVAPLAYMRGRTLNNSVVILDEAQNTTLPQLRMLLTRLGQNSKAIITGDDTQIDLPRREDSGLLKIQYVLRAIEGIRFVRFGDEDVVRHHLVQEIILAFDDYDGRTGRRKRPSPAPEGGERS